VRATSGFIRLFIRGLAWDAERTGVSFLDGLKKVAFAKRDDVIKGKVLIGTTSAGTGVTFTLPPLGSLSAEDVAEVCSRLLDQCDVLIAATPSLETDSEAMKVALLNVFKTGGVRSFQTDFRGLRH
jgi:hypothetical protein